MPSAMLTAGPVSTWATTSMRLKPCPRTTKLYEQYLHNKSIDFPKEEYPSLEKRFNENKIVITHRVDKEYNKYFKGDILSTPFEFKVKVISVDKLKNVKDSPFINDLTKEEIKQIGNNPVDLIRLKKEST